MPLLTWDGEVSVRPEEEGEIGMGVGEKEVGGGMRGKTISLNTDLDYLNTIVILTTQLMATPAVITNVHMKTDGESLWGRIRYS